VSSCYNQSSKKFDQFIIHIKKYFSDDDALETVSAFTFRDLSGNCMAILQAADALPTTTVATTTVSTTTTTAAVSTTTASATTTTAAASGKSWRL
jgi:hypothetical protein